MHGAALAWSLVMPPGTALLELWPQPNMWRLYEHTAQWAGLHYRSVPTNAFTCSMHTCMYIPLIAVWLGRACFCNPCHLVVIYYTATCCKQCQVYDRHELLIANAAQ